MEPLEATPILVGTRPRVQIVSVETCIEIFCGTLEPAKASTRHDRIRPISSIQRRKSLRIGIVWLRGPGGARTDETALRIDGPDPFGIRRSTVAMRFSRPPRSRARSRAVWNRGTDDGFSWIDRSKPEETVVHLEERSMGGRWDGKDAPLAHTMVIHVPEPVACSGGSKGWRGGERRRP